MAPSILEHAVLFSPPDIPAETDSETALLLVNIGTALRALERADDRKDLENSLRHLELALHTYGSVKHLLPKLNLTPGQRAPVQRQLEVLLAEILAHSSREER